MHLEARTAENHWTSGGNPSPDRVETLSGCPRCGATPAVGVLCAGCAAAVRVAEGLVPGHVIAEAPRAAAMAWLIDGFGHAHPIGPGRTVIGRRSGCQLSILAVSVSREHAELRRTGGGWELRDLGSRNRTRVDGKPLTGCTALARGAIVRFGDVHFVFSDDPVTRADAHPSIATAHARGQAARYVLEEGGIQLCLIAGEDSVVLLTRRDDGDWSDVDLAPLELRLLGILCAQAIASADLPSRTCGCVPSKELVRRLPFATDYATEENVRKVVQRTRASLAAAGIPQMIETVPNRGYHIAWSVALG